MLVTWDMITEGPLAGTVIQPLTYTTTVVDRVRVTAWVELATEFGSYRLDLDSGTDFLRIRDGSTSDAERSAIVNDVVLSVNGVTSVIESTVTVTDGTEVTINSKFMVGDTPVEIGF